MLNEQEQKTILALVDTIGDTIREATETSSIHGIPSGHLYAFVMSFMSLSAYSQVIAMLKARGEVVEKNHLLTWVKSQQKES